MDGHRESCNWRSRFGRSNRALPERLRTPRAAATRRFRVRDEIGVVSRNAGSAGRASFLRLVAGRSPGAVWRIAMRVCSWRARRRNYAEYVEVVRRFDLLGRCGSSRLASRLRNKMRLPSLLAVLAAFAPLTTAQAEINPDIAAEISKINAN